MHQQEASLKQHFVKGRLYEEWKIIESCRGSEGLHGAPVTLVGIMQSEEEGVRQVRQEV